MVQENQSTPEEKEIGQDGATEQNSGQDIGKEGTRENSIPEGDSDHEQAPGQSSDDTENIEGTGESSQKDGSSEDEQSDISEMDIDESTGNPGLG